MTKQPNAKDNLKSAAILTLCDNRGPANYGQILQCYAMVRLFSILGTEPYVVLYRKKGEKDRLMHNFSLHNPIGRYFNTCYETYYKERIIEQGKTERRMRFNEFIQNHIPHSTPCYTKDMVEHVTKNSPFLICGSDQIWNPLWTDSVWQLDFGTSSQRRIAYAPSGIFHDDNETFNQAYKDMIPSIEKLDYVTLREESGLKILRKYTDKPMSTAPDPTLLLSSKDWDAVCSKRLIKDGYLFCYTLGSIRPYPYLLQQIAKASGAEKIVYIPSNQFSEGIPVRMEPYSDGGPSEFLSLIRHAKAVCTDSFHGAVFSILYGKSFYCLPRAQKTARNLGGSERISSLMSLLEIPDRTLDNLAKLQHLGDLDYPAIYEKLNHLREYHMDKLKEQLP